jgi:hypothetical protein
MVVATPQLRFDAVSKDSRPTRYNTMSRTRAEGFVGCLASLKQLEIKLEQVLMRSN